MVHSCDLWLIHVKFMVHGHFADIHGASDNCRVSNKEKLQQEQLERQQRVAWWKLETLHWAGRHVPVETTSMVAAALVRWMYHD